MAAVAAVAEGVTRVVRRRSNGAGTARLLDRRTASSADASLPSTRVGRAGRGRSRAAPPLASTPSCGPKDPWVGRRLTGGERGFQGARRFGPGRFRRGERGEEGAGRPLARRRGGGGGGAAGSPYGLGQRGRRWSGGAWGSKPASSRPPGAETCRARGSRASGPRESLRGASAGAAFQAQALKWRPPPFSLSFQTDRGGPSGARPAASRRASDDRPRRAESRPNGRGTGRAGGDGVGVGARAGAAAERAGSLMRRRAEGGEGGSSLTTGRARAPRVCECDRPRVSVCARERGLPRRRRR